MLVEGSRLSRLPPADLGHTGAGGDQPRSLNALSPLLPSPGGTKRRTHSPEGPRYTSTVTSLDLTQPTIPAVPGRGLVKVPRARTLSPERIGTRENFYPNPLASMHVLPTMAPRAHLLSPELISSRDNLQFDPLASMSVAAPPMVPFAPQVSFTSSSSAHLPPPRSRGVLPVRSSISTTLLAKEALPSTAGPLPTGGLMRVGSSILETASPRVVWGGSALGTPDTCACGNVFMPDSNFCRKCGARRPSGFLSSQMGSAGFVVGPLDRSRLSVKSDEERSPFAMPGPLPAEETPQGSEQVAEEKREDEKSTSSSSSGEFEGGGWFGADDDPEDDDSSDDEDHGPETGHLKEEEQEIHRLRHQHGHNHHHHEHDHDHHERQMKSDHHHAQMSGGHGLPGDHPGGGHGGGWRPQLWTPVGHPAARVEPTWMDSQWYLVAPVDFKGLEQLPEHTQHRGLERLDHAVRHLDEEGKIPPLPPPRHWKEQENCPIA